MKKRFGIRLPMALLLLPFLGPVLPIHGEGVCVETSEPLPAAEACATIVISTCAMVGVDEATQTLCIPVDID